MISTKGRYSIRILLDLAEHHNGGYIPMKEILGRIVEAGYEGYFAIEHFDATDQEKCMQRSAAFLRDNFQ